MRELLVAPIRRASIVLANVVAVMAVTALQLVVLIAVSALPGAQYQATSRMLWFIAAAILLVVATYGLAEILATRLTSAESTPASFRRSPTSPSSSPARSFPSPRCPDGLGGAIRLFTRAGTS